LREEKPGEAEFFKNSIQLVGKAGDAVVFDSMLRHAGGEKLTCLPRRAITKVFTQSFMKQQINYTKATILMD
jgi:ectoine hydroxylase-related dioxygenase (phytanoyl-CoA dioxygenase family)